MRDFSIGIIGGTGGIGGWFADFFAAEKYSVHIAGRKTAITIPYIAANCRVVIVAVPMASTIDVIREAGPLIPEDSLLMDLTSLKEEPVREMLATSRAEVVGCHPLFGPDVPSLAGQNIVLCPARGTRWLNFLQGIFEKNGSRVTLAEPAEHDRMMSLVQGLNHLETILMGLTLRDSGIDHSRLSAFSTPVFRAKQAIIEKVCGSRPGLYAGLVAENHNMPALIEIFERNWLVVKDMIMRKDTAGLEAMLSNRRPSAAAETRQGNNRQT